MAFHTLTRLASILILALTLALPARAVTLPRDTDMEHTLTQIAAPIMKAEGLSPTRVKILVVDDGSRNPFVFSNDTIFIHSGLICRMDRTAMLQAVISHKVAHIANGHLTRRMSNLGAARTAAGLGTALAVMAVAGAGEAAADHAVGTQSTAHRSFLRHSRAEEASAGRSGLRYMRAAGIPVSGMREVMQIFRGQEALSEQRQDPYVRSHLLSRGRLRVIDAFAAAYGNGSFEIESSDCWIARAKGKLTAYKHSPSWTLNWIGESGYADVALMREAMAQHRNSQTKRTLSAVNKAVPLRPKDPFFYDLKGEVLMATRQFSTAASAHAQAVQRRPNDALLRAGYGRALLASGDIHGALAALERARSINFRDGSMLRDLSVAYARTAQRGMASLITAERYALRSRLDDAGIHEKRAMGLLPEGSGPWQRAQDVLIASERAAKKKKRR